MKKIKFILIGFVLVISILGCDKEPSASFTTDKNEYIAGEIVHLTNTSSNGSSFLWTLPDGTTSTSNNIDYQINSNAIFEKLTFNLEAFDKDGDNNSISKSVQHASVYSIDSTYYYYVAQSVSNSINGGNWVISAAYKSGPNLNDIDAFLYIYFPGNMRPSVSGTYNLQSNNSTLSPGQAYIDLYIGGADAYSNYISLSGQLNVIVKDGIVHAIYNHIDAKHTDYHAINHPNVKISGDIICF